MDILLEEATLDRMCVQRLFRIGPKVFTSIYKFSGLSHFNAEDYFENLLAAQNVITQEFLAITPITPFPGYDNHP